MSVTDEYLRNNAVYAERFSSPPPLPPARHVTVVTCMDARLNVYGILGLAEGEAHVIRNAGGVVTDDEIRSLAISQGLLGTTEVILIHHMDCGMLTFTDDQFKRAIQVSCSRSRRPSRSCARCSKNGRTRRTFSATVVCARSRSVTR
jgi:carbonic anhydrase